MLSSTKTTTLKYVSLSISENAVDISKKTCSGRLVCSKSSCKKITSVIVKVVGTVSFVAGFFLGVHAIRHNPYSTLFERYIFASTCCILAGPITCLVACVFDGFEE